MPLDEEDDVGGCSVKSKACAPELRPFDGEVVRVVEVAVGGVLTLPPVPPPPPLLLVVVGAINELVCVVGGAVTGWDDARATGESFANASCKETGKWKMVCLV